MSGSQQFPPPYQPPAPQFQQGPWQPQPAYPYPPAPPRYQRSNALTFLALVVGALILFCAAPFLIALIAFAGGAPMKTRTNSEASPSNLLTVRADDLSRYTLVGADNESFNRQFVGKVLIVTGRVGGNKSLTPGATGVEIQLLGRGYQKDVVCEMQPGSELPVSALKQRELIAVQGTCEGLAAYSTFARVIRLTECRLVPIPASMMAGSIAGDVTLDLQKMSPETERESLDVFFASARQFPRDNCPDAAIAKGRRANGSREGEWTWWYGGERKAATGVYELGMHVGEWLVWHPNGQLACKGHYQQGEQHGRWEWWYANGAKSAEGDFNAGRPTGTHVRWYENGKQENKTIYDERGEVMRELRWNEDGSPAN